MMSTDDEDDGGKPARRSLSDYSITTTDELPRGAGKSAAWPALGWSKWAVAIDFLRQTEEHRAAPDQIPPPDLHRLLSIPGGWGPAERITIVRDPRDGRELIGLHFRNYVTGELHVPRVFDPPCGLLLLLLVLPGGSLAFNRGGAVPTYAYHGRGDYKVPVRRLLADAKVVYHESDAVSDTQHPFGYRSYLVRDWSDPRPTLSDERPTKRSYRARDEAFRIALDCLRHRATAVHHRVTSEFYLSLLFRCAAEVDHLFASYATKNEPAAA